MCNFFALCSRGDGMAIYLNAKEREIIRKSKKYDNADSHTTIADFHGFAGKKEDKLNKYEYNPLTNGFVVDQINNINDSKEIKQFCKNLDFKDIVPELIIHKIVNPLKLNRLRATKKDIELLKKWASVWDSVRAYISSFFILREWKYTNHNPGENPFQPAIDLWNSGIVPAFDGKTWRLHGKSGKVIWEGKL